MKTNRLLELTDQNMQYYYIMLGGRKKGDASVEMPMGLCTVSNKT